MRDRGGRVRLRDGKRTVAQVSAGGPGGDRGLRGDRGELVRGPRRAGGDIDRRGDQIGQHGTRGAQLPHREARGGGGTDGVLGGRGGGGLRGDRRAGGDWGQGADRNAGGAGFGLGGGRQQRDGLADRSAQRRRGRPDLGR